MPLPDQAWRADAACAGRTDLFFVPAAEAAGRPWSHDEAKLICAGCPVFDDCLGYVRAYPQPDGVWAGMVPAERRRDLQRRDRRQRTRVRVSPGTPERSTPVAVQSSAST